jgi:DNA-binding PadR family transcriptional regulator
MVMTQRAATEFLPLKPVWYYVLLVLGDGRQHGYAIGTAVEELTDGAIRMWPATLYGTIHQLEERGLITVVNADPDLGDDPRRRYCQLTSVGKRVLAAETESLRELVRRASRTRALRQA